MKPLVLLLLLIGLFSSLGCEEEAVKENKKYSIPSGLVGVRFEAIEKVSIEDIDLSKLQKLRSEAEDKNLRWFFKEFDRDNLLFHVAKYVPNPVPFKRPWGTYVVQKIYRIKRSKKSEKELGVSGTIDLYETGAHGIKAGMSEKEVVARLGKPEKIIQLGPFGAFDYLYDDIQVRFLEYRVASTIEY